MQTLVLHPGTQHSRQTALALQELGRLEALVTGLFDHEGSRAQRLADLLPESLARPLRRELGRFASPGLDPARVRALPWYELPERLAYRAGAIETGRRIDALLNRQFGRKVAGIAARHGPVALWGYDNSAFAAFGDPRTAACPKILDRTIADGRYWNEEQARIEERHGDWLAGGTPGWSRQRIERNDIEYEMADRIVCGSPFVMESVARYSPVGGLAEKLTLLPYTWDAALFGNAPQPAPVAARDPVRFLFVGQISARKGVQHLLEAFASLPRGAATLTLVGPVMVPERMLAPYSDRIEIVGPVPRSEVPGIMQRHHAFVFPSHFEGSAIALVEAMASGLAIIQTRAAGLGAGPHSGFVLEQPDAALLTEAMTSLIEDRERLHAMRHAAMRDAKERDFAAYCRGILQLLEGLGI